MKGLREDAKMFTSVAKRYVVFENPPGAISSKASIFDTSSPSQILIRGLARAEGANASMAGSSQAPETGFFTDKKSIRSAVGIMSAKASNTPASLGGGSSPLMAAPCLRNDHMW